MQYYFIALSLVLSACATTPNAVRTPANERTKGRPGDPGPVIDLTHRSACQIKYRGKDSSGMIRWTNIAFKKSDEGLDFVNPASNKPYRFRLFSNTWGRGGVRTVDAIIQDLSIKAFLSNDPSKETTTADGYVAHSIVDVNQAPASLVLASEINGIVVECDNLDPAF